MIRRAPDASPRPGRAPTPTGAAPTDARDRARAALARARTRLLEEQDAQGVWRGELGTNVTIEAEDLFLREFLGILDPDVLHPTAAWIRTRQRDDGTWANFHEGPGDISTTVEAYVALRLAGDAPEADHMQRAVKWIVDQGGLESTRAFTRIWLALHGWWDWDDLPAIPPEMIFLPAWVPFNIYDFGCWARQTIVALSIVRAYRPVRPASFGIDELRSGSVPPTSASLRTWKGWFTWIDRALRRYERRPLGWLRAAALHRAESWVMRRQEADGSWGGIQPPWVYSIIALRLRGYGMTQPVIKHALEGLERFTIWDGGVRRLEACQSPVWDTALALVALADAGVPSDAPALQRAGAWLVGEEVSQQGDWAIRRPYLHPGGWAFEYENRNYPDVDDTAEVILALRRVDVPAVEGAIDRGVAWTLGMQCADGGWAAFDADNTRTLCRAHPFCDFGEVIDPPSADVTAHAIEMLALEGKTDNARVQRGIAWLRAAQEPDGSWFGRWGANFIYGTGAAVPALVAAGVSPDDPSIRRAVHWLASRQNPDGGWGEDLRSYDDPAGWSGRGASTASQTAWALLALVAAGDDGSMTRRGVAYLVDTQREDGSWDEPLYTGTGFPGAFYVNYHLYRLIFPVMALGRYVNGWHAGRLTRFVLDGADGTS